MSSSNMPVLSAAVWYGSLRPAPPNDVNTADDSGVSHNLFYLQHRIGGAELKKVKGVDKWNSRLKAYGYVNPDDDGHHKIKNGEQVDFESTNDEKKPKEKNAGRRRK